MYIFAKAIEKIGDILVVHRHKSHDFQFNSEIWTILNANYTTGKWLLKLWWQLQWIIQFSCYIFEEENNYKANVKTNVMFAEYGNSKN